MLWKKNTPAETKLTLNELETYLNTIDVQDWHKPKLEEKVGEWIEKKGYSVGSVLWPMRVALSGQKNSPGPHELAEVLGKVKSQKRLTQASRLL